jgi:hypothetical protein
MPYDDFSILGFLKRKLKYKFIYISSYIHPNIVMKTLQQIYENPLYMNANVSIKPNWQGLMEFVSVNQENENFKKKN